jgi:hydroxypyruvate isomerase
MDFSICIEMIFPELRAEDRIARLGSVGFEAVEFWDWRDKSLDALALQCRNLGLRVTCISGHRAGSLLDPLEFDLYKSELILAVEAARHLSCTNLMLLTNPLGPGGQVLNSYPAITPKRKHENCIHALVRLAHLAVKHDVVLLLEPLNSLLDHPGYWLDDAGRALEIIRSVHHPQIRLLYDLYHMMVMGRDVRADLERNLDLIGYVHAADVPGRHEPGTGDMDYSSILHLLDSLGYSGTIGFEFSPAASSTDALQAIRSLIDPFI